MILLTRLEMRSPINYLNWLGPGVGKITFVVSKSFVFSCLNKKGDPTSTIAINNAFKGSMEQTLWTKKLH